MNQYAKPIDNMKFTGEGMDGKSILITGGTGSFGQKALSMILETYKPKRVVIYSRDEYKQSEMAKKWPDKHGTCPIRYFIGDVRDPHRLESALKGIDYVIHAAAMKQVPKCEYDPIEAIKTNINGAANVIEACVYRDVQKVIALSTDKAQDPINLYGATKLCSDKLFVAANNLGSDTRFSVVRYGNVWGSRGSVVPLFQAITTGVYPVTHGDMTRFTITLTKAVDFVFECFDSMLGGEVFIPKLKAYSIVDLVKAIDPEGKIRLTGIRPGEKLHEMLGTQLSSEAQRLSVRQLRELLKIT